MLGKPGCFKGPGAERGIAMLHKPRSSEAHVGGDVWDWCLGSSRAYS